MFAVENELAEYYETVPLQFFMQVLLITLIMRIHFERCELNSSYQSRKD